MGRPPLHGRGRGGRKAAGRGCGDGRGGRGRKRSRVDGADHGQSRPACFPFPGRRDPPDRSHLNRLLTLLREAETGSAARRLVENPVSRGQLLGDLSALELDVQRQGAYLKQQLQILDDFSKTLNPTPVESAASHFAVSHSAAATAEEEQQFHAGAGVPSLATGTWHTNGKTASGPDVVRGGRGSHGGGRDRGRGRRGRGEVSGSSAAAYYTAADSTSSAADDLVGNPEVETAALMDLVFEGADPTAPVGDNELDGLDALNFNFDDNLLGPEFGEGDSFDIGLGSPGNGGTASGTDPATAAEQFYRAPDHRQQQAGPTPSAEAAEGHLALSEFELEGLPAGLPADDGKLGAKAAPRRPRLKMNKVSVRVRCDSVWSFAQLQQAPCPTVLLPDAVLKATVPEVDWRALLGKAPKRRRRQGEHGVGDSVATVEDGWVYGRAEDGVGLEGEDKPLLCYPDQGEELGDGSVEQAGSAMTGDGGGAGGGRGKDVKDSTLLLASTAYSKGKSGSKGKGWGMRGAGGRPTEVEERVQEDPATMVAQEGDPVRGTTTNLWRWLDARAHLTAVESWTDGMLQQLVFEDECVRSEIRWPTAQDSALVGARRPSTDQNKHGASQGQPMTASEDGQGWLGAEDSDGPAGRPELPPPTVLRLMSGLVAVTGAVRSAGRGALPPAAAASTSISMDPDGSSPDACDTLDDEEVDNLVSRELQDVGLLDCPTPSLPKQGARAWSWMPEKEEHVACEIRDLQTQLWHQVRTNNERTSALRMVVRRGLDLRDKAKEHGATQKDREERYLKLLKKQQAQRKRGGAKDRNLWPAMAAPVGRSMS